MRLKLRIAFSLLTPLLLLTMAVVGMGCSSSKHGAASRSFGQAEKIEALTFDEEGRRFDNLYLAALSQKLAGNLDAYYTLRWYACYEVNEHLTLHMRVENLTNQKFITESAYPYGASYLNPGTAVYGGCTIKF